MKMNRMLMVVLASACAAGWSMGAHASAKDKFAAECAECHEPGDFEGEDAKGLDETIKKIKAGEVKHKAKITISDLEIKELADYLSKGGK